MFSSFPSKRSKIYHNDVGCLCFGSRKAISNAKLWIAVSVTEVSETEDSDVGFPQRILFYLYRFHLILISLDVSS